MSNKTVHMIAFLLMAVGGINWGLIGLGEFFDGDWNVVSMLLGAWPMVEALVYLLVGVSTVYILFTHKKDCKHCMSGGMM